MGLKTAPPHFGHGADFIVAFNGVPVESSDDLFRMLTEEKIGIFQDVTVIRHDKKIDLRVTPVEARMRA
jgi:S1-C subfamily serine protease